MSSNYSIEKQLTVNTAMAAIAVFLFASLILDYLVTRWIKTEYDNNLTTKIEVIATLLNYDEDGLEFELADEIMPEFNRQENPEYFQIIRDSGEVFDRSNSLKAFENLPASDTWEFGIYLKNTILPDGKRGRQAEIVFLPKIDDDVNLAEDIIPEQKKTRLIIAKERESLENLTTIIHGSLFAGCILLGIVIALQMRIITKRSLSPLNLLREQITQLDPNRIEQRINIGASPLELSVIVDQFNEALSRIEQNFHRERRFTGDVAHELRTPISELRTMAEVALRWKGDTSHYEQLVQDLYDISMQMQTITNNLLALARSDKGIVALDKTELDISQIISRITGKFIHIANAKNVKIRSNIDGIKKQVISSKIEIELVLTNIINNAIEYSDASSTISIEQNINYGTCAIIVKNKASDLEHNDLNVMFERMWRKDKARTSSAHSGLGMALIKSYTEQLNLDVQASLEANNIFVIRLSGFILVS